MPGALLGLCGIAVILLSEEVFWRFRLVRGELSRSIVHLLVGTYIAFWPFMMSMRAIQILAGLMLLGIVLSRRYKIFQSIHAVRRRTYGEFFFPVSVGICAILTKSDIVFMAAILHLSLADGLASLLGRKFGKSTRYRIFGQDKSWFGTFTFYLISLAIVAITTLGNIDQFLQANVWLMASLPILVTAAESVAVYGFDDFIVPIMVTVILAYLQGTL